MKNNKINWKATIGMSLEIEYFDEIYTVKILEYTPKKQRLLVKYKNRETDTNATNFKKGHFGAILGIIDSNYKRTKLQFILLKYGYSAKSVKRRI